MCHICSEKQLVVGFSASKMMLVRKERILEIPPITYPEITVH